MRIEEKLRAIALEVVSETQEKEKLRREVDEQDKSIAKLAFMHDEAARERDSFRQKLQDQEQGMQNLSDKVEGLEGTLEIRDDEIARLKEAAGALERMYEPQLAKERMNAKAEHDLRVQAERRLAELQDEVKLLHRQRAKTIDMFGTKATDGTDGAAVKGES